MKTNRIFKHNFKIKFLIKKFKKRLNKQIITQNYPINKILKIGHILMGIYKIPKLIFLTNKQIPKSYISLT